MRCVADPARDELGVRTFHLRVLRVDPGNQGPGSHHFLPRSAGKVPALWRENPKGLADGGGGNSCSCRHQYHVVADQVGIGGHVDRVDTDFRGDTRLGKARFDGKDPMTIL